MYQIGDLVMYGIHGVCKITDEEERHVDHKSVHYLVLEPLGQVGARFLIPAHNEAALAKLRPVLSREDLDGMLRCPEVREDFWIADENQRKQYYRELINSGDRIALLRMVHTLRIHRQEQAALGRKFHLCDENFLRDAERLLSTEFSLVLGIAPEEVGAYIQNAFRNE